MSRKFRGSAAQNVDFTRGEVLVCPGRRYRGYMTDTKGREGPHGRDKDRRVIVLGLGNILLRDEGVGVRVIERMQREYVFPENVTLFDGATAGLDLMPVIEGYDDIIIVDTVNAGEPPGSLFRFTLADVEKKVPYKTSLHQIGVLEMFAIAEAMGRRHDAVIIGVQPEDMSSWGLELTATVEARVPEITGLVLKELEALGIRPERREGN